MTKKTTTTSNHGRKTNEDKQVARACIVSACRTAVVAFKGTWLRATGVVGNLGAVFYGHPRIVYGPSCARYPDAPQHTAAVRRDLTSRGILAEPDGDRFCYRVTVFYTLCILCVYIIYIYVISL